MENNAKHIVIIGAGIVGVSTAIWLLRAGIRVTILDKLAPGEGTSFGNAGILASCSVAPVTAPGMIAKSPKMLMDPEFPLYLRWGYLPKLLPWLLKYLSHANDKDTKRISRGLSKITSDSIKQHRDLIGNSDAANWVKYSDYSFVYPDRAAFEADHYTWALRQKAGFVPELIEGDAVQEFEPTLAKGLNCLAVMKDHGYVLDPSGYVKSLAQEVVNLGGDIRTAEVTDFKFTNGKISEVKTKDAVYACDNAVLSTGVWSKKLSSKLGLNVPIESERGYHIVFKSPSEMPKTPLMITTGKFVATPMAAGLRCAGIVEFGGLEAGASEKPLKLLEKKVKQTFPTLTYDSIETWLGHRPAPSDSLPLIGEIKQTGVYAAFGHHHIGLTAGPKTGRMVADLIAKGVASEDISEFSPNRFA